ncbi:MAG: hypothetical protein DI568_12645 [Sphingomonas sp.]|nr:MAG: hypothetical protein DI568_12645 [Sphingomonas sp.]
MPQNLTPLEMRVIAMSRGDLPGSLARQSRLFRWIRGQRTDPLPLADPRLEALRRYAILYRMHGKALDERESRRLRDAGFSPRSIEDVRRLTAPGHDRWPPEPTPSSHRNHIVSGAFTMGFSMPQTRFRARLSVVLGILPFALCHVAAQAQQGPPAEDQAPQSSNDDLPGWLGWIIGPSSPGQGNQFALGVGAAYMPAYMGSRDYRFQPLPAIDIKYGRFFVTFQDGIGAKFLDTEMVTVGAGITMADNYRSKDTPDGIGGLSFGVGGRGFVTVRPFGFEATAGLTKIFAGSTGGVIADFNLSRPVMVNERLFINPTIGTRWANGRHNNRYFGVNAAQSQASGLSEFKTGSGFLDAKAELGVQYRLTEKIGIGAVGGVTTLLGDVKNSPIVEKKTAPFAIGFISYSF